MEDVLIIGAGVAGTMIARALSFYGLKIRILDKENDVANETSLANSAIVHAGYDAAFGTQKGRFNVAGNKLYDEICEQLDVPFKRVGSLVIGFDEEDEKNILALYENGLKNQVPKMQILEREEILMREPHINKQVKKALYAETAGIVSPWELGIKACENAMENGALLDLNTEVKAIEKEGNLFRVHTNKQTFSAKMVINCAGVYSDQIHDMLGHKPLFSIRPRKGEYYLFDKEAGGAVKSVIFQCPSDKGKGILVAPTVHGNLIVGPNSYFVSDKDDVSTTSNGLLEVREGALKSVPSLSFGQTITTFSGLRASSEGGDFILGPSPYDDMFINVAGYDSPGLASVPAVALFISEMARMRLGNPVEKSHRIEKNKTHFIFAEASDEERKAQFEKDPAYGQIVCRCESITEGEIRDVIGRKAGATTIKGVRKRTRAGAGRCQGGFCGPKVLSLLSEMLKKSPEEIVYDGTSSYVLEKREGDDF